MLYEVYYCFATLNWTLLCICFVSHRSTVIDSQIVHMYWSVHIAIPKKCVSVTTAASSSSQMVAKEWAKAGLAVLGWMLLRNTVAFGPQVSWRTSPTRHHEYIDSSVHFVRQKTAHPMFIQLILDESAI